MYIPYLLINTTVDDYINRLVTAVSRNNIRKDNLDTIQFKNPTVYNQAYSLYPKIFDLYYFNCDVKPSKPIKPIKKKVITPFEFETIVTDQPLFKDEAKELWEQTRINLINVKNVEVVEVESTRIITEIPKIKKEKKTRVSKVKSLKEPKVKKENVKKEKDLTGLTFHKGKYYTAQGLDWLTNRVIGEEQRQKMSDARKGRKHSEETKAKMRKPKPVGHGKRVSEGRKGMTFSEEHIKNMSIAASKYQQKLRDDKLNI